MIILIYDWDDVGMKKLEIELKKDNIPTKSLLLNGSDLDIYFFQEKSCFQIRQADSLITDQDFTNAKLVLFHRWRMKLAPFVNSSFAQSDNKQFAEREWEGTILGLLLFLEQQDGRLLWVNRPSTYFISRNKYFLMSVARTRGFQMPECIMTTDFKEIDEDIQWVTKSISSDRQVSANNYLFTSMLDRTLLSKAKKTKIICPSFLQRYLKHDCEIRVYFLINNLIAIRINVECDYVDIKTLPFSSLHIEEIEIPNDIRDAIKTFCDTNKLAYCCFDFLLANNEYFLIDITPNGSWIYYEEHSEITLTDKFKTIIKGVYEERRSE